MRRFLKAMVPNPIKQKLTAFAWKRLGLSTKLKSGLTVQIQRLGDWWIYNDIWVHGEYNDAINLTLSNLPQGRKLFVLDIGANVGMFALRFFDLMQQKGIEYDKAFILMVEGSPALAKEIEFRITSLPIPKTSYRVVNGLVGKRSGSARLSESGEPAQNFLSESGTEVPFIDLSNIVPSSPIDLLKCDIEGSEEMFLSNYPELIAQSSVAIFELHHTQCDVKKCKDLLSGFPNHQLVSSHSTETVEMFWR
jgi:FkbM family methyltransferase